MRRLRNIIISRTDSIGDVVLTLPMAKIIKDKFPDIKIAFLGKNYTKSVVECCEYVDEFIELDDFLNNEVEVCGEKPQTIIHVFPVSKIAKRAKAINIPVRIGTTNRLYHWFTCNKLIKLSRKNSDLHEAQLNLKLLSALGIEEDFSKVEIGKSLGFTKTEPLNKDFKKYIHPHKYNLILHPKSQGSAREWGLENFIDLVKLLDKQKINILVSGTEKERKLLNDFFDVCEKDVTDITGVMNLNQFISFINNCDGLVANSTGPLHIAAALGKNAFGIYPPIRPMHPGRWAPLGEKTHIFVMDKDCNNCRKQAESCVCIKQITAQEIAAKIYASM